MKLLWEMTYKVNCDSHYPQIVADRSILYLGYRDPDKCYLKQIREEPAPCGMANTIANTTDILNNHVELMMLGDAIFLWIPRGWERQFQSLSIQLSSQVPQPTWEVYSVSQGTRLPAIRQKFCLHMWMWITQTHTSRGSNSPLDV